MDWDNLGLAVSSSLFGGNVVLLLLGLLRGFAFGLGLPNMLFRMLRVTNDSIRVGSLILYRTISVGPEGSPSVFVLSHGFARFAVSSCESPIIYRTCGNQSTTSSCRTRPFPFLSQNHIITIPNEYDYRPFNQLRQIRPHGGRGGGGGPFADAGVSQLLDNP